VSHPVYCQKCGRSIARDAASARRGGLFFCLDALKCAEVSSGSEWTATDEADYQNQNQRYSRGSYRGQFRPLDDERHT
jgi:hypothetical protein